MRIAMLLGTLAATLLLTGCITIFGSAAFTANNGKYYHGWVRTRTLGATNVSIESYWEGTTNGPESRTERIRYRAVNDSKAPRDARLVPTETVNCTFSATPQVGIPPSEAREVGVLTVHNPDRAFTFNYEIRTR